jgi:toxin ParE1/3/4
MIYRLARSAQNDVREIVSYYSSQKKGLGLRFANDLELTCSAISENPLIGRPLSARTRRWLMGDFPYLVLYRVLANDVLILKIVHEKRDPANWQTGL